MMTWLPTSWLKVTRLCRYLYFQRVTECLRLKMVTLAQLPSAQQSISSSSAEWSITSFQARSLLIAVAKLILPGNIEVEFKINQTASKYIFNRSLISLINI